MDLAPLLSRLSEIAGTPTPHPVALYAIHTSIAGSTNYAPKACLSRENAKEVEERARKLRAFSLRWGRKGIISKGDSFIPLLMWWNCRTAFAKSAAIRRSH